MGQQQRSTTTTRPRQSPVQNKMNTSQQMTPFHHRQAMAGPDNYKPPQRLTGKPPPKEAMNKKFVQLINKKSLEEVYSRTLTW
eukprot:4106867-Amphidinium_carterae.2